MPGILIVDDNATIRGLLRSFVETNTGFEVCGEAENGPDGIQKTKELQPDLVLLDMTMPGMLGTEAARILKRLLPQVKIILFTLHTDGVNQALASTFDIDIVLSKTDIIANLQEHLIALLAPVHSTRIPTDIKDKRSN
jgi:DNA-binding NarL/FixJ family response regulator